MSDAINRVVTLRDAGAAHVVRADIADCFPSLDRHRLLNRLAELAEDDELVSLVKTLINRPVRRHGRLVRPTRGIPQGSPLSPILSNLYLHDLDTKLLEQGHATVRYCDDLTIATENEEQARRAIATLHEDLKGMGLSVREDSTEVMSFAEGFAFLGEQFTIDFPGPGRKDLDSDNPGRTLYVHRPGAFLRLRDGQFQVVRGKDLLFGVPVGHVSRIVLFGGVNISGHLRSHALYKDVPITFLSRRGRWLGDLRSASHASVVSDTGARLSDEARTRLLTALEARLQMRFAHVASGQRTSYRRALYLQARSLASCVRDPRSGYEAVRWR